MIAGKDGIPVVLVAMALFTALFTAPEAPGMGEARAAARSYTLVALTTQTGYAYQGVGGEIGGLTNPVLRADAGDKVRIVMRNGDGVPHDVKVAGYGVKTPVIQEKGREVSLEFTAGDKGRFDYFCTVAGHREAGMEGVLAVGHTAWQSQGVEAAPISADPTATGAPIKRDRPATVSIEVTAVERDGALARGAAFRYWTFDSQVPGPFHRVRVGDVMKITFSNHRDSKVTHSVDFHAVTGPGGGAAVLEAAPGQSASLTARAVHPGLYVYHCATPVIAEHVAKGMYGLILVEPEGGLPPVDREFYIMQGELYTRQPYGAKGRIEHDQDRLLNERPGWYVFNGADGALLGDGALRARVGERIRIHFGVGGPNKTSSFHVIGEMFDAAYLFADLVTPPARSVQTVTVPPGGAAVVDIEVEVPGTYVIVDHALSRYNKGLVGHLVVEGKDDPEIFKQGVD
jgi:nitrite reductase (NO-forming)